MSEILLVDDEPALRRWERRVLEAQRYTCAEAADVPEARAALAAGRYELALLDVNLPGGSGMELLSQIRVDHPETAVLMVTGEDDLGLATAAIELGAYGYLVKPVRAGELVINVTNAMHRRRRESELLRRVERLETSREQAERELRGALTPDSGTADIVKLLESETVNRLVRLAEFRDAGTGQHLIRMGRYCELIGQELGHDDGWCAQLRLAAELHDVGKVAIPDRILLKPGRLTANEREVMKTHTEIGHRILSDSDSELLRTAATTALSHHERWDGSGYPRGLADHEIPVEGRIAAVADVFDALTSDRVYRPAFPVGMAVEMMEDERGRHFEPVVLDALHGAFDRVESIRRAFGD
ncbi:MAG: HD domain-containing phosphohydrolase [Solirubrobacteraceae bacterium]